MVELTITAYKCTLCGKLSETGFIVAVTSANRLFSFKDSMKQDSLKLEICEGCLERLPGVILSALH